MANIEEKVTDLLEETINSLGYTLYDVEYIKEGKDYFLRVYIDKETGINLDDCEKVSNAISDLLDEKDIIKDQYFLEVSSPGIERILRKDKHLEDNIGNQVEIKMFKPIDNKKQYIGELVGFDNEKIILDTIEIDRKNISQIKTVYEW